LRERVLAAGGRPSGNRVVFSRGEVDDYLRRWRERNGLHGPGGPRDDPWPYSRDTALGLAVMPYSHTYLDPFTDRHVPLTAVRLKDGARFLGTFHEARVDATVPGHPADVAPPLQPLLQYKLGAQYNPAGGGYGWTGPPASAEYLFCMAEVMGRPITAAVVYVFSPLRLGGAELETAVACRDRLRAVHVANMGSCGGSLPLLPKTALVLSWAEAIAGAMCVEAATGLPANWHGGLDPFDLRAQTIPFGAPEQVLLYRLTREADGWLCGGRPVGGSVPLLTMAKRPGAQAALEKTAAGTFAIAHGCIGLGAGGSLSADEVFSPAQLVLDCELRDWLIRAARGLDHPADRLEDAVATIREGVAAGSFAMLDGTLDHYREVWWFPRHLRREMLSAWEALGSPDAAETARREACERLEGATWVLPEPRFSRLEDLYDEARRRFS
jgi:hypothetical protein